MEDFTEDPKIEKKYKATEKPNCFPLNIDIGKSRENYQSPEFKLLNTPEAYPKSSPFHGIAYQLKLLMLFILNALDNSTAFRIATEMTPAEKFDDVVLNFSENEIPVYRFLQAKHKQDDNKTITLADLLAEAKDSEYSLQKYFISYQKIRRNENFKSVALKDFIMFTNIDLDDSLLDNFELIKDDDIILKDVHYKDKTSKRFRFKLGTISAQEDLMNKLKNTSDLNILANKLATNLVIGQTLELKDLLKSYHTELLQKVIDVNNHDTCEKGQPTKKYFARFHASFLQKDLQLKELEYFRNALIESYIQKSKSQDIYQDDVLQELATKEFSISKNFGKINETDLSVKNVAEIDHLVDFFIKIRVSQKKKDIMPLEMCKVIKDNLNKFADILVNKCENEQDLYNFSSEFLNGNHALPKYLDCFRNLIKEKLSIENIDIQLCIFFIPNLPKRLTPLQFTLDNVVTENDIALFFNKLLFVVNQPNEEELDDIIYEKLRKEFNDTDTKTVYTRFMVDIFNWMKAKSGCFRTQTCLKELLENIKKDIFGEILFEVKPPVKSFSGRKKQLLQLFNTIKCDSTKICVLSQIKSISGLGGIGKTELARQYIQLLIKKSPNTSILWINAENELTLETSFRNLAKDNRVRIPTEDVDGRNKDMASLVREIYRSFSKRRSLFIFDNAERGDYFRTYLPLDLLTSEAEKPNILITSRIATEYWERWGIKYGITLDVFTDSEAITFVIETLQVRENDYKMVKKLAVDVLHNFPLALQQALSHINEQNFCRQRWGKEEYTIHNYIEDFKRKKLELLNYEVYKRIDNDYTKTTYTTWKITFDKIKNEHEHGQLALEILYSIVYLAPNNIPIDIFATMGVEECKYYSAVDLLNRYSMIKQKQGKVDIHALVQEVTKLELIQKDKEMKTIENTFHLLRSYFQYVKNTEDYVKIKDMIPHLESFLTQNTKLNKDFVKDLLQQLQYAHCVSGNPRRQKELLEDILEIQINQNICENGEINYKFWETRDQEKQNIQTALAILEEQQNGNNCCVEIGFTLHHLAIAYEALGDHATQKELLEKALPILEKVNDNIIYALTLHSLGNCYGDYGDYMKKKALLERALIILENIEKQDIKIASVLDDLGSAYGALGDSHTQKTLQNKALLIKENIYGIGHISLATTLSNLGNAYRAMGNYEKQKELQEKALSIKRRHYEQDHVEIAITLDSIACAYGSLRGFEKQKELLKRALAIKIKHYGKDHIKVATTQYHLGNAYGDLCNYDKQKILQTLALKVFKSHYSPDHINVASILIDLSEAYKALGEYEEQVYLLEMALSIQEKHFVNDNTQIANTKYTLGNAYGALGDYRKQIELQETALKIKFKLYGNNHIDIASILNNLGKVYGILKQHEKQKILHYKALQIQINVYGYDNITVAKTKYYLSIACKELNEYQQQIELQESALMVLDEKSEPSIVGHLLEDLGNAFGNSGNVKKQIELQERALTIFKDYYGEESPELALTLYNIANAYASFGDTKIELYERALAIQRKYYTNMHINLARTINSLGKAYGNKDQYDKQKELQEEALPFLENFYGADSIMIARVLSDLGNAYLALEEFDRQKYVHERALCILENNYEIVDDIEIGLVLSNLSCAYEHFGAHYQQIEANEKALPILKKYYGDRDQAVAQILCNLGNAYRVLNNTQKQIAKHEEAMRILEGNNIVVNCSVAETLYSLVDAYNEVGDLHKQINVAEKILVIEQKRFGEKDAKIIKILTRLSNIYKALGNQEKRIDVLEKILEIEEKEFEQNHITVGRTLHTLGNAYGIIGDYFKQIELQERALVIYRFNSEENVQLATLLQNLGHCYGEIGDYASKVELLEKALPIKVNEFGIDNIEVGRILQNIGHAYTNLGKHERQIEVLERVLPIFKRFYGCDHVEVARVYNNLSNAYKIMGDNDRYRVYRNKALAIQDKIHGIKQ